VTELRAAFWGWNIRPDRSTMKRYWQYRAPATWLQI
jgi:hypothetical protein